MANVCSYRIQHFSPDLSFDYSILQARSTFTVLCIMSVCPSIYHTCSRRSPAPRSTSSVLFLSIRSFVTSSKYFLDYYSFTFFRSAQEQQVMHYALVYCRHSQYSFENTGVVVSLDREKHQLLIV